MPASIHVSVILFCLALFVFALIATGFFMYNAFGNPYETLHGPLGLYLWSFISGKSSNTLAYRYKFIYQILM